MSGFKNYRRFAWFLALWAGLAFTLSTHAIAGEWRIVNKTGDVRVHGADQQWVKAQRGQLPKSGDSVWTGRASRAQLSTSEGTVLLKPRSLVKVPTRKLPSGMTVLFQGQGEVTAKVRKKKEHHFAVQTPYLAAVVKGTEFTVNNRSDRSRLSVSEGVVGAVEVATGGQLDVGAGQGATVSETRGSLRASAVSRGGSANLGNDDDPSGGRSEFQVAKSGGGIGSGNNGNGNGNPCGGNCGNGNGNGGGNGTGNEGNN